MNRYKAAIGLASGSGTGRVITFRASTGLLWSRANGKGILRWVQA